MDPKRFDTLTKLLSTKGPRRGLLRVLAAVPLAGGVVALFDQAGVQGFENRHGKHGQRGKDKEGRDDKGRDGKDSKSRDKHKRTICKADSRATTCNRRCGKVRN